MLQPIKWRRNQPCVCVCCTSSIRWSSSFDLKKPTMHLLHLQNPSQKFWIHLNFPQKNKKTHSPPPSLVFQIPPLARPISSPGADGSSLCIKSSESIDPENADPAVEVDPVPFLGSSEKMSSGPYEKRSIRFDGNQKSGGENPVDMVNHLYMLLFTDVSFNTFQRWLAVWDFWTIKNSIPTFFGISENHPDSTTFSKGFLVTVSLESIIQIDFGWTRNLTSL